MPLGGRYDMSVHGNMFQENIKLEILKIFQFENFEFQYQKYLTTEKYFKDLRRCKIKFWTTFVFYTKLIFPLLFELESFENFRKYLE